jgi:predicted DNA-binding ribbon-helix-helix protein
MKKIFSFWLDIDIKKALEKMAKEKDRSIAKLINKLLRENKELNNLLN